MNQVLEKRGDTMKKVIATVSTVPLMLVPTAVVKGETIVAEEEAEKAVKAPTGLLNGMDVNIKGGIVRDTSKGLLESSIMEPFERLEFKHLQLTDELEEKERKLQEREDYIKQLELSLMKYEEEAKARQEAKLEQERKAREKQEAERNRILAQQKASKDGSEGNKKVATNVEPKGVKEVKEVPNTVSSKPAMSVGSFNASYYGMDCVGCSGRTASGYNTKGRTHYQGMRVLAADTSILPLGTIVKVKGSAIGSFTGIVLDRGGAIKGKKLDILVGSEAESSGLGRQNVQVEVVSYGNNKYNKID